LNQQNDQGAAIFIGNGSGPSYINKMTDDEFDASLVRAAFTLGAEEGWHKVSAASAARHAGLDLARASCRFSGKGAILKRFGTLADSYSLSGAGTVGLVKDRLFDLLLRRFDFLQTHRAGVVALLRYAPLEPGLGPWLACETLRSMGWLLEGAGVSARGVRGELRRRGLAVVWAWGVRAWLRDETEDLSATMAAVDTALTRADQIAARLNAAGARRDGFVPEAAEQTMPEPASPAYSAPDPATAPEMDNPEPPAFPPSDTPGI
jgi:ubiquinone biosynthesis protein COQ9